MDDEIPVERDWQRELPVPSAWRETIVELVDCLVDGAYERVGQIPGVTGISSDDAIYLRDSIKAYGDDLVSLPSDAWRTSIYRATGDGWQVLVDLYTVEEGASDLVLFLNVAAESTGYRFTVRSVHVP